MACYKYMVVIANTCKGFISKINMYYSIERIAGTISLSSALQTPKCIHNLRDA